MKENMVWKAERAEHAPTVELGIYYESGEPEKRLFSFKVPLEIFIAMS